MERRNKAPSVNTSACLCRVDTSRKAANRPKRFIPASKLCTQSIIKPSIHPSKTKPTSANKPHGQSPLLPGLPDDLAIACLIRVPRADHHKLRLVCKRWYRLLAGNYFYTLRKNLKLTEEWIYVITRDKDGKISLDAFDPIYQNWHPLPPVPGEYSKALGFGCVVLSSCHLYLFGGENPIKGTMRRVIFYSARTNKWHRAPDMLRRRHFFGSCVMNNCIYVAGGEGEGIHRSLRSTEFYDPRKNKWSLIQAMSTSMVPFISIVYKNKWFLKGLGPFRQVQSEAYNQETDTWAPVFNGMVTGWRNPCVCIDGKLYALGCKDGCKIRVYNDVSDSWSKDFDSEMHLRSSRTLEAAALVSIRGKLCILRNNMSILLVDVKANNGENERGNGGRWEMISGKGQSRSFIASILLNIAGWNRVKSHIVHCQVLQA